MDHRRVGLVLFCLGLGWAAVGQARRVPAADGASPPRRPNVVVLLADDLGYGELGCQGNPEIPTPHVDSIAAGGVRFTSGYVTASYCSPSRAGLLSGRYQTRFGYEQNPVGALNEDPDVGLPPSEITLAKHLHGAGYTTALIGKWHLGGTARYHPLRRGFDEFFGFLHEGHFYVPPPYRGVTTMLRRKTLPGGGQGRLTDGPLIYSTHMGHDEPPYDADNPILRGGQPVEEPAYLTDALTREAVDFIERHRNRPFFLYLAYNAVHSPLQGADRYMRRFARIEDVHRRIFAAMLSNLDDSVGAVLEKLRSEGLEEHTLVFFLSDNGGPTRELTSSNLPLRGGKGDVYEGGIRVPFMCQWKGTIAAGEVYRHPVISLDVLATAAAAAQAPVPERRRIDGVNLLPYLLGRREGRPHEVLYWRMGQRAAIRVGDWKLVRNARRSAAPWEVYDLDADVGESNNVAETRPEKRSELLAQWERLNREMAAQ
ncbi:MAG: sulfatase-like hydrolase/transferase [Planctomycetota bacterium]|jgi:arylsulfatase B